MFLFSYYVGLDVHRKSISFCVKRADGTVVKEGKMPTTREAIREWAGGFDGPWLCGLEATICSHWIYEELKPFATRIEMANPSKLKAISTAKRKNDQLDARALADLLRCNMFPPCYVPPPEYESLRCFLRQRALLVRTRVMFKNKTAGLLIQRGVPYETHRLHGKRYYTALLGENSVLIEDLKPLLAFNRTQIECLGDMNDAIVEQLVRDPLLKERDRTAERIDRRSRRHYSFDVGGGSGRTEPLPQRTARDQLLRIVRRRKGIRRRSKARAAVETAQRLFADHTDRGCAHGGQTQ